MNVDAVNQKALVAKSIPEVASVCAKFYDSRTKYHDFHKLVVCPNDITQDVETRTEVQEVGNEKEILLVKCSICCCL